MKASAKILAVLALGAGLTLVAASPAAATNTTEPKPVCGTWSASVFAGPSPGAPGASAVEHTATTATLTKPAPGTGVEYLRKGLDIDGPAVVTVTVDATAAEAASGAVRIFGYSSATPNTMTDAPTYGAPLDMSAVATGPGELTFTVEAGEHLRALGFTYDSSNDTAGSVKFGPGTIGDRPINFNACPEASASPSVSPSPTKSPTKAPTRGVTATPSELPLTGPGDGVNPLAILLPIGGALLLGGVGFVLVRRRRDTPTFTAE
jgi:hypothetical protein